MAFEVFDDVAFYWFLMSCTVAFVIPITYSFLSTLKWRRPDDWTRKLGSCKEKMSRNDKDARAEQLAALLGWRGMCFVVGWLLLLDPASPSPLYPFCNPLPHPIAPGLLQATTGTHILMCHVIS